MKKNTKHSIFLVSAAIFLLLVTGTILYPIKSYAALQEAGNNGGFLDSHDLNQGIHDEIRADLKNTNESINQENLCVRSNTCRQSAIGENVIGNDNQVTGFADQSDNLQPSTTTANITTPTPTPTPTRIPGLCPDGTIFDVTLQEQIDPPRVQPVGTVLCLKVSGTNNAIVSISPFGNAATVIDTIVEPVDNECQAGFVHAAFTSGVLPSPLSGTTVCVIRP